MSSSALVDEFVTVWTFRECVRVCVVVRDLEFEEIVGGCRAEFKWHQGKTQINEFLLGF